MRLFQSSFVLNFTILMSERRIVLKLNSYSGIKYSSILVSSMSKIMSFTFLHRNLYETHFSAKQWNPKSTINHWLNSTLYKLHCLNRWFIFIGPSFGAKIKLIPNSTTGDQRLNMQLKNAFVICINTASNKNKIFTEITWLWVLE